MRVKICGFTRQADVAVAVSLGVDAIGLVFADSPRRVTLEAARQMVRIIPPFVTRVGVFVNVERAEVLGVARELRLDCIQLHGDESPEYCMSLDRPVIKAVRPGPGGRSLSDLVSRYKAVVDGILLDSYDPHRYGGTGRPLCWEELRRFKAGVPILLSGGLRCDNVGKAIGMVRPWGVDVSSGVESAPGIKDAGLMKQFLKAARRAFKELPEDIGYGV